MPVDLRAARFVVAGEEMAVFSYRLQPSDLPKSLTAAEREVALAIIAGRSNAEIAVHRGRSPRTVANQVASLFVKLGLRSRNELAVLAYRNEAAAGADPVKSAGASPQARAEREIGLNVTVPQARAKRGS
jgi:DNA-binding CsgD family transcriptional regulator